MNHGGSIAAGINAAYTDLGANGQPALSDNDQSIVQMRRQQVEFSTQQSGTNTNNTNDVGGGLHHGSLDNGDWIALNRSYYGATVSSITFRYAGLGADVEVHTGSQTGPLLNTFTLASTGANNVWASRTFPFTFTGTQRRFFVFRPTTGGPTGGFGNLNWIEFVAPGVGIPPGT